jgi:hypothetical protein
MAGTPNSILTPQKPVSFTAVASLAEVTFNAPTNMVTLVDETVTGNNDNGLRLTQLVAINRNNNLAAAVNCQLYKKVGSTYTQIDSTLMASGNPSATVANQKADFGLNEDNPLILAAGIGLAVAIGSAATNGIAFRASGGAY